MRFENFGESLQEKGVLATSIRNAEIKNVKTQKKDETGMVRAIVEFVNKKVGEEMKRDED